MLIMLTRRDNNKKMLVNPRHITKVVPLTDTNGDYSRICFEDSSTSDVTDTIFAIYEKTKNSLQTTNNVV